MKIKESLIALEKTISELSRYKRQPCINCEYKLICAGECEKKLINRGGLAYERENS